MPRRSRLTVVVDGISQPEYRQDGVQNRGGASILAIEVSPFDALGGRRCSAAFGQLRVELDERCEAGAGPPGLKVVQLSDFVQFLSQRGWLTRERGVATLGGMRVPSWRRIRDACIVASRMEGTSSRLFAPLIGSMWLCLFVS